MIVVRQLLPDPEPVTELDDHDPDDADDADDAADARDARDTAVLALADRYGYPDPVPEHGWVRANMISTLDGSATDSDGVSGGIGGPADQAVFSALRGLADVVLVGAGTAAAEEYRMPPARAAFAERRRLAGQGPAPQLAVLSRRGVLPEPLRSAAADEPDPARRPILLTGTIAEAVAELAGRGLRRVLFEGGPRVLGQALADGVVNELCVTLAPLAVAGDGPRIAHGPATRHRLRPVLLLEAGGMLFGRWHVLDARPAAG